MGRVWNVLIENCGLLIPQFLSATVSLTCILDLWFGKLFSKRFTYYSSLLFPKFQSIILSQPNLTAYQYTHCPTF